MQPQSTCPHCGVAFVAPTRPQRFCSRACYEAGGRSERVRPLADRFWPKVDKGGAVPAHRPELGPCWLWTASLGPRGYGQIGSGGHNGHPIPAHRVSWELAFGPIPEGLFVLHACDVRRCVRPSHLFLGTIADNNADMWSKGRGWSPWQPGEAHMFAVLTWAKVRAIRTRYAAGAATKRDLAAEYGISETGVHRIIRRLEWWPEPPLSPGRVVEAEFAEEVG